MKKQLRRVLAILCAVAFAFTGITYSPSEASAETWFNATCDWNHYMTDKTAAGDQAGIWDYCCDQNMTSQKYANGDSIEGFTWSCGSSGEAVWLETTDLRDIKCVTEGGQKVKPTAGVKYLLNMTVEYTSEKTGTTALQVWCKNGEAPAMVEKHLDAKPTDNQLVIEDAEIMPEDGNPLVLHMGIGVKKSYAGWGGIKFPSTVKITNFSLVRADDFNPCIMGEDGTFKPAGTPWTVKTQYDGSQLWGKMSYKVDGTASNVASTYLRVDTAPRDDASKGVDQDDPSAWWWWNSAKLAGYLENASLTAGKFYKGSMKVEYTSTGTSYATKLRTIFGGTVMVSDLADGENTIAIDEFLYEGTSNDIEFNLDLLEDGGIFRVTEINLEPADDFTPMEANKKFKTATNSPWTFEVQNDKSTMWGAMSYIQEGTATDPSSTTFRVDTPAHDDASTGVDQDDPEKWWWWNKASLENYLKDVLELKEGYRYKGTIKFNYTRPTNKSGDGEYDTPQLRMIENGNVSIIDLVAGENTINIGGDDGFTYSDEFPSIEFNLDLLDKGGILQATSIVFERADDFEPVTPNVEGGFNPEGTPWYITVQNDKATLWGQMSYSVEGTASLYSSTKMRVENPGHDDDTVTPPVDQNDPDAWWWWNSAALKNYLPDVLVDGRTYTGSMVINYTAPTNPEEEYTPKLRYILNGEVFVVTLQPGENTIPIESFDYSDQYPNVEFNFDLLEKNSTFQLASLDFTQAPGNWMRVPDNEEEGVTIPVAYDTSMTHTGVVTHYWNVFAGIWEGHGAALYYDNDLEDYRDPLKIKIGAGERWDPACAQIKLTNEDAYQELEEYTNYYMTYTFTSTEKGTLHINQEGYTPIGLQRVDITDDMYDPTDGLYHVEYKKIFTYLPDNDDLNLTMFLTPTTYVYNEETHETEVKMDGEYLPAGTILANHKITYSRQDEDGWTLVTDSRDEEHQMIDTLVKDENNNPALQAYTNSFGYNPSTWSEYDNGRMSYLPNQNPDGIDDIAKMGIRLDSTSYSNGPEGYTFNNQWANHIRIPNSYFYDRLDTNGYKLENGNRYILRLYFNSTEATADGMGAIMVRQPYEQYQWFRYPIQKGLNLVNGTITPKKSGDTDRQERDGNPYIVNKDYKKTGGIEFTYVEGWSTEDEYVQIDFSEFPKGTIINDLSWEFEAVGYNVFIDGNPTPDNTYPILQGDTYTFPEQEGVIGYKDNYDDSKIYQPGEQVPYDDFTDDIYVTSIRGYKVQIVDTDGNPLKTTYVDPGDPYNFPSTTDPDFADYKEYDGDGGPYHNGDTIQSVNKDYTFVAVPKNTYIVTVKTPDGEVLRTTPVPEGGTYTFPSDIPGVKDYTYNNQTYDKGDTMGPVNENREVIANPATHTVTIVDANDPTKVLKTDEVDDNTNYTLPELDNVKDYTYNGQDYDPKDEIGPITQDVIVYANPTTHTVTIVNSQDPSDVLLVDSNVPHGTNYQLPTAIPNYDIQNYVWNRTDYQPGQNIGPINKDEVVQAVLVPYYNIYIDGVAQTPAIRDGGNYTFPSGQGAAKIGYISVNGGKVLDPGTTVGPIHEDRYYLSVDDIEINKTMGASMLLNEAAQNSRGIGFGAEFVIKDQSGNAISRYDNPNVYTSESFKLGTMITTEDLYYAYFEEQIDLDAVAKAAAEGHPEYIRNIMNDYTFCDAPDPTKNFATYRAGIINLNDYNITRNFIARSYGYVETANGQVTDVVYGVMSDVRSIKTVATNLMKDPNWRQIYDAAWKQEIIEYCAAYED